MKKILAIDFDETIAKRSSVIKEGDVIRRSESLIEGSKEFINVAKDDFEILIFSARTDIKRPYFQEKMRDMIEFLDTHGVYYDRIVDVCEGKPYADFYIDDKAINFNNNWDEILDKLGYI